MIGKVRQNDSFRATAGYVLGKPGARIIGGNMVGSSLDELAAEFCLSRDLKPMLKRPVGHLMLSLPHHESLSDEPLVDLGDRYLQGMGFDLDEHQYVMVRHIDRQHEHVHIIASRINVLSGLVADDSFERYRSQAVVRGLERDFNLTPVLSSWEVGRRSPTRGQRETLTKTGVEAVQTRLQNLIEKSAQRDAPVMQFLQAMSEAGVDLAVYSDAQTNEIAGISYSLDGVNMSGSDLGNRYTFPGLQRTFNLQYEPERDNAQIQNFFAQTDRVNAIAMALLDTARLLHRYHLNLLDGKQYRLTIRNQPQRELVLQRKRQASEGVEVEKIASIMLEKPLRAIEYSLSQSDVEHFEQQQEPLKRLLALSDQGKLQINKIVEAMQL